MSRNLHVDVGNILGCDIHFKNHTTYCVFLFQVRAAAVFALGTFISNTTERSDHANNIDHSVAMTLISITQDGSSLVRKVRRSNWTLMYQDLTNL